MATNNSNIDQDLALHLQMQEVMTESLIMHAACTRQGGNVDFQTLQLIQKLIEERTDAELREAEMRLINIELKRRVHDQKFAREILQISEETWRRYGDNVEKPFRDEGSSSSTSSSRAIGEDSLPFRLYFKGLHEDGDETVGDGSLAAIGAAVCDPLDNLILHVEKPVLGDWKTDCEAEDLMLKLEVKALVAGLTASLALDIKRIDFFCDYQPLFHYITNRSQITQQEIGTIVDQVYCLQRKFVSCRPFFVAKKDVKFAFELARSAVQSVISRSAASSVTKELKETCLICLENTDVLEMFDIDGCSHRYCLTCMKLHVEIKLLHGISPGCPHEGCNTQLLVHNFRNYLPPKLIDMWTKHMEEASIPATEKLYCPYPKCSALMSKSEVLQCSDTVPIDTKRSEARKCFKCDGIFCINCKVPWHIDMSCCEYLDSKPNTEAEDRKLKSLANKRLWRQCMKCNNMIELSEGCYHITCRCDYEFCYTCGAEWKNKKPTCLCPIWDEHNIIK